MKVKAKCNIKFGSEWIPGGKVMEVSAPVYNSLRDLVEIVEYDIPTDPTPAAPTPEADNDPEKEAEEDSKEDPEQKTEEDTEVTAPAPAKADEENPPKQKTAARAPRRTSSTKK